MVADVLEGGPVSRPQRQAPLDKVLALWKSRGAPSEHRPSNRVYHFIYDKKLPKLPVEIILRKRTWPRVISSSCSKGMSPHTMSYNKMPRDHTVAERPWYLWCLIHSGGLYTRVPVGGKQQITLKKQNKNFTQKYNTHDKMKAFQGNQRSSHVTLFTNFTHSPKGGAKIEKRPCCYASIFRLLPEGIHADAFIVGC